jgi:DNA-binding CsgD family transcriptional regulator
MSPGLFDSLSHAISSAGSPSFYDALFSAVQQFASVDLLRARVFRSRDGVQMLGVAGAAPLNASLHDDDEEHARCGDLLHQVRCRRVLMRRLERGPALAAETNLSYGIGYVWRHGDALYLLDLFRSLRQSPFAEAEERALSDASRLVASIDGVHATRQRINIAVSSNCRDDIAAQVVKFLGAGLTRREAEVVSRIVMGMRTEAIATELGIKSATVITFRKRAYAKLGVARQAELFARCVQVFSDLQPRAQQAVH